MQKKTIFLSLFTAAAVVLIAASSCQKINLTLVDPATIVQQELSVTVMGNWVGSEKSGAGTYVHAFSFNVDSTFRYKEIYFNSDASLAAHDSSATAACAGAYHTANGHITDIPVSSLGWYKPIGFVHTPISVPTFNTDYKVQADTLILTYSTAGTGNLAVPSQLKLVRVK